MKNVRWIMCVWKPITNNFQINKRYIDSRTLVIMPVLIDANLTIHIFVVIANKRTKKVKILKWMKKVYNAYLIICCCLIVNLSIIIDQSVQRMPYEATDKINRDNNLSYMHYVDMKRLSHAIIKWITLATPHAFFSACRNHIISLNIPDN